MSIRTSRANGSSETIEVDSLGGRPTHKPKQEPGAAPPPMPRMPFCGKCGHKHANEEANFCCKCDNSREPAASSALVVASVASVRVTDTNTSVVAPAIVSTTAVADAAASSATVGRPALKGLLSISKHIELSWQHALVKTL